MWSFAVVYYAGRLSSLRRGQLNFEKDVSPKPSRGGGGLSIPGGNFPGPYKLPERRRVLRKWMLLMCLLFTALLPWLFSRLCRSFVHRIFFSFLCDVCLLLRVESQLLPCSQAQLANGVALPPACLTLFLKFSFTSLNGKGSIMEQSPPSSLAAQHKTLAQGTLLTTVR